MSAMSDKGLLEQTFIVNEIFASINGEGPLTGEPTVFIRLAGCNLRCSYCDTQYAQLLQAGKVMSISDILNKVKSFPGIHNITLTGGEPLFAKGVKNLISVLTENSYFINIETNGSINLKPFMEMPCQKQIMFCCDYKLASSGEEKAMDLENITLLRENDALKFVIGAEAEFEKIAEIINTYAPKCFIYLSPVFNQMSPQMIVSKTLEWGGKVDISRIRVQLQLHKYIWNPSARGV